MVQRLGVLYEGKSKIIYATDEPDLVIQHFKDDATAFDGVKSGAILGKGRINNCISCAIFSILAEKGIKTHFVRQLSDNEMLVRRLDIIPVEVVVRNWAAGSLSRRFGIKEGALLSETIIELYYKSDELHDPMINEYHIKAFGWAEEGEIEAMKTEALRINDFLVEFFKDRGIKLVDYKLEFGRYKGELLLGDEITPDSCRLWDIDTDTKLDKDRFRFDLGGVREAYAKVHELVCGDEMGSLC